MKRPSVYVDKEVKQLLDDVSYLTGSPKKDLVDNGLTEYLNKIINEKGLQKNIDRLRQMRKDS